MICNEIRAHITSILIVVSVPGELQVALSVSPRRETVAGGATQTFGQCPPSNTA